jgi:lipid-binding SYLF domain-containing protein
MAVVVAESVAKSATSLAQRVAPTFDSPTRAELPMLKNPLQRLLLIGMALLLPTMAVHAEDPPLTRAQNAVRVLAEIMQAPDKAIPQDLLRDAKAIAVIPDLLKVGFVFGGRRGEGLVSVKSPNGTWSNPSFITMTGGSVGFQVGVSSTDVVLIFRTQRGVDSIVRGKFTLGADASAAAGPVGRTASAATDEQLKAEIYSYSRTRGLFAGVALDGSALRIDYDANAAVYGAGITPRRIFEGGVSNVPTPVVDFRDRLEEYTSQ